MKVCLWPDMKWKGRQKPNHGSSLSSGIQVTSKYSMAFILMVQNGCLSSSHHMHLSTCTSILALQAQTG